MRIFMSKAEIRQIEVMEKLKGGEIAQGLASDMIGRSVRTVRRKLYRYKANGASGLCTALVAGRVTEKPLMRSARA